MKFALESLGKKATVIKGDSEIPKGFMHFPGANEIVQKNFGEVNLKEFDLFISLDSASPQMISRFHIPHFPLAIPTIVIDHHRTNPSYGSLNLVEPTYPALAQILFDLFHEWDITITPSIAQNLLIGIYGDTGGFKYEGTTARTLTIASKLIEIAPHFSKLISQMECSDTPATLAYKALAFSSIETFFNSSLALSVIASKSLKEKNIPIIDVGPSEISSEMRTVEIWKVCGTLVEVEPNKIRLSFRSNNADQYDVSKLAVAIGGGGHRAASGAVLEMPLADAVKLVVQKAKELYNL